MDRLNFKLEVFEGPLDLLLHLIKKNKLDIYDIKISVLVDQYIQQINYYKIQNVDIASEFLEMAARLVYIKTLTLLPKHQEVEELKSELTGKLIEYQLCKKMAEQLSLNVEGFNTFIREPIKVDFDKSYKRQHSPDLLINYYFDAVGRGQRKAPPPAESFSGIVSKRIVSVSSKIIYVMRNLWRKKQVKFKKLFENAQSRSDVVATFLAVLELVKDRRVVTTEIKGETVIKKVRNDSDSGN